jgi:peptidyl-tRNA hydrolase, PTH1 family
LIIDNGKQMKPSLIIIGLGNPGAQYQDTRHNVGFASVDILGGEFGTGVWLPKQKFLADIMEGRVVTAPILLVKPVTYMNDSGNCVKKLMDFYKLTPRHFLIICDDIDQPVGEFRLREEGGPGTHNGLRSIANQIGESFLRLRIGVLGADAPRGSFKKAGEDLSAYILSKPSKDDCKKIEDVLDAMPNEIRRLIL